MSLIQKMKEMPNTKTGILGIAALVAACSGVPAWDVIVSADATGSTADPITTEISLGDLNGDTEVNASDAAAVLIAAAYVGTGNPSGLTENQEIAADLNGDGAFDAVDAAQILNYAAYVGSGGTATLGTYLKGEHETVESTAAATVTTTAHAETSVTTTVPVQTTAAQTTTASAATQPAAETYATDLSKGITQESYYGIPWTAIELSGQSGIVWVSPTRVIEYSFYGFVMSDYEIPAEYYDDFMLVYNNELACGNNHTNSLYKARKYLRFINTFGRENVLYTNDIEDDGILSSSWGVWYTTDGETWYNNIKWG